MIGIRARALTLVAAIFLASASAQRTWIVDAAGGPGVDFQQVQPAVDASAPGDVVVVRPGTYDVPVVVDRGIKVLADPAASLTYVSTFYVPLRVRGVPAGQVAAVRGFDGSEALVRDCDGTVLMIASDPRAFGPATFGGARHTAVTNCRDVRLRGRRLAEAIDSRVEVVQTPTNGGPVFVESGARVHAAHWRVRGRDGAGDCPSLTCYEENGLPGVWLSGGSDLVLGGCEVYGGDGGTGIGLPGLGAPAITAGLGAIRASDSTLLGGCHGGLGCTRAPALQFSGTVFVDVAPRVDPTLQLVGDVVPGGTVTMRVTGTPGDNVRFFMGRLPVVQAAPGSPVPVLARQDRASALGPIPGAGFTDYVWTIPSHWSPGTLLFTQVSAVAPDGQGYLSNSVPLLVH